MRTSQHTDMHTHTHTHTHGFWYLPGLAANLLGTYLGYPSIPGEAEGLLAAAVPLLNLVTLEEGPQRVQSGLSTEPRQELWLWAHTYVCMCVCLVS